MQATQIRPFDKQLDIRLTGERVTLPRSLQVEVDVHWQDLLQQNSSLHNGEVFTVRVVQEDAKAIHIQLAQTDYAHLVYSRQFGGLGDYAVDTIHPAALVIAGDRLIFGSMSPQTSLAGVIQCCGGGIDHGAVGANGVVDIGQTIKTELLEELGIKDGDKRVASCKPTYLTFGGPDGKMVLIYIVHLNQTSQEFMRDYDAFVTALRAKNEEPEFDKLFCIERDAEAVEAFIEEYGPRLNEYMEVMLRTVAVGTV